MICPHCHTDVEGIWENTGIGSYEYWGQQCNDSRMTFLCENCSEELETENSYEDYVSDMKEYSGRYQSE